MEAERSECTKNLALELVRRKEQQHLNSFGGKAYSRKEIEDRDGCDETKMDPDITETLREMSICLAETR